MSLDFDAVVIGAGFGGGVRARRWPAGCLV
jgi:choline dehydrogenase-like flavoprotein